MRTNKKLAVESLERREMFTVAPGFAEAAIFTDGFESGDTVAWEVGDLSAEAKEGDAVGSNVSYVPGGGFTFSNPTRPSGGADARVSMPDGGTLLLGGK